MLTTAFLGFADIVNTYTVDRLGARRSYQVTFWFEVACAAVALIILVLFVKIKKAESEMTVEEREELELAVGVDLAQRMAQNRLAESRKV